MLLEIIVQAWKLLQPHLVLDAPFGSQCMAWEQTLVRKQPAGERAAKGSSTVGAGTKRSNEEAGAPWATGPDECELDEVRSRAIFEAMAAPA